MSKKKKILICVLIVLAILAIYIPKYEKNEYDDFIKNLINLPNKNKEYELEIEYKDEIIKMDRSMGSNADALYRIELYKSGLYFGEIADKETFIKISRLNKGYIKIYPNDDYSVIIEFNKNFSITRYYKVDFPKRENVCSFKAFLGYLYQTTENEIFLN